MSPAEALVWSALKSEQLRPLHFRRQVRLGPYYADFASHSAKVVIEVDGSQHFTDEAQAYDARRDSFMHAQGYRILRFTTLDVITTLDGVYAAVLALLPDTPS
jgi:very-short-patch-repair endonuclease